MTNNLDLAAAKLGQALDAGERMLADAHREREAITREDVVRHASSYALSLADARLGQIERLREALAEMAERLHATHAHVTGGHWSTCDNVECERSRAALEDAIGGCPMSAQTVTCGHSACTQHWVDTGRDTCVLVPAGSEGLVADLVTSLLVREGEVITPSVALERANNMACWLLGRHRELGDAVDELIDAMAQLYEAHSEGAPVQLISAIEVLNDAISGVCAAYDAAAKREKIGGGR